MEVEDILNGPPCKKETLASMPHFLSGLTNAKQQFTALLGLTAHPGSRRLKIPAFVFRFFSVGRGHAAKPVEFAPIGHLNCPFSLLTLTKLRVLTTQTPCACPPKQQTNTGLTRLACGQAH